VPGNLRLQLDFDGYSPQTADNERALLRVCQEAVSNVIRHAEAKRVRVVVRVEGGHVHLYVADDGRGMPADAPRGIGLAGMERRLAELGGSLRLRPRRPRGTVLRATLPRRDAPSRHPDHQ
jgi:signal transduction histidine kinase